jgi:hypothetical protein
VSKRIAVLGAASVGLLLALPVHAAPSGGGDTWSVEAGKTVGAGANVFWGQAGFPDINLNLVTGIDALTDIGGRLGLDYGSQGVVNGCCNFGMNFQFLLRRNFFDSGKMRIAGTFDPGFVLEFIPGLFGFGGGTQFGLLFPIGVQFGFPVSPVVTVSATFDLAMRVLFSGAGSSGYFVLPILFGGGIEYALKPNLLLTFQLKLGPTIFTATGASAQFTLYALLGIAYKF